MTEPITTELRGVMSHTTMAGIPLVELGEYEFASRCDAIDAVHGNLERENAAIKASVAHAYASGYEYAEQDRDGWVELPKDADGVPIHIGDKVTCARSVWEVTGLRLTGLAWGVCCTIFNDHGGSGTSVYPPCDLRHYHAPTVEDVLLELLDEAEHFHSLEEEREAIAEYAAKLRLAGDAE